LCDYLFDIKNIFRRKFLFSEQKKHQNAPFLRFWGGFSKRFSYLQFGGGAPKLSQIAGLWEAQMGGGTKVNLRTTPMGNWGWLAMAC